MMGGGRRRQATKEERRGGRREEAVFLKKYHNIICIRELTDAVVLSRDSAETKCNQTIRC
jgi:hypothetical protein